MLKGKGRNYILVYWELNVAFQLYILILMKQKPQQECTFRGNQILLENRKGLIIVDVQLKQHLFQLFTLLLFYLYDLKLSCFYFNLGVLKIALLLINVKT